ncbi:MAG TPA: DsbA family protein [Paenirhodobacter sp.]
MTRNIDYFFGLGSPWAYVGLQAFAEVAKRHDAQITPYVITLIEENGGIYSRNRPAVRRAYWTTDLKRWAHLRGVKLEFSNRDKLSDPTPAGDLIVAAWLDGQDWLTLAAALHQAFWGRAEDIGQPQVRQAIADAAGFDGAALEVRARSEAVTKRREDSRRIAAEAGVFGMPTYRADGELFWGQDSLPFLDRHLAGETLVD